MNWSAFFSGAPAGFSQGMDWGQKFEQNQQMNPLLLQHQQLQNQQLGQDIGHSGITFNREGNVFDALMRQYMPGQGGQGYGQQPGMSIPGQHKQGQPPQGTVPTATPQYQDPGNAFAPQPQGVAGATGGGVNPFALGNTQGGMNMYPSTTGSYLGTPTYPTYPRPVQSIYGGGQ